MSLAAGGGTTAGERNRESRKGEMQTNSQQGGSMTCSEWSVKTEEGSGDRWKDTALSAKILSHSVCPNIQTHPHLLHHPAAHSYSSLCHC